MSRLSRRHVLLAGAVAGGAALFGVSSASALTSTVDIRVEHDLLDSGSGPRVLERTGVTPGPGVEVTVADEISNPSNWGGNVSVDIDPDTQQIIVAVEDENCYDTVVVTVTSAEIASVTTVSDAIFAPDQGVALSTSVSGGVATLSWAGTGCPDLNTVGSQAVFSYTEVAPTTTTTAAPTTTTTAPSTTTTAAGGTTSTTAGAAVAGTGAKVTPAFTG